MKPPKRIKYRSLRQASDIPLPSAHFGTRGAGTSTDENLTGMAQGKAASAGEERAVRASEKNKNTVQVFFRVPVGGARNTPGWKELDLLIEAKSGLYYMVEVDSAFTHRTKGNADILHDAILLHELSYLNVYPQVLHVDNDRDLADQQMADETFRRLIV